MNCKRLCIGLALGCALLHGHAHAADALESMSLEELMSVEVTSVSLKSERVQDAAAAVYVLSHEDLHRSGTNNIPDALRQVPGLHVARIDATKWAVTARGFNGRFSNKLLVLVDGRQIYTPYFGGVLWDEQRLPFDLIERIEIIRGPGATLWGANAVNGVINVITRRADASVGSEVELSGGTRDSYSGYARHAGALDDDLDYRVYVSSQASDPVANALGSDGDDAWRDSQVGARLDWSPGSADSVTVQMRLHRGDSEERVRVAELDPLRVSSIHEDADARGGFLMADWQHTSDRLGETNARLLYDDTRHDSAFYDTRLRTYEISLRNRIQPFARNDLVWGLTYRKSRAELGAGSHSTLIPGTDDSVTSFDAFVQDELAVTESLSLIVGSKLQRTESTGWEPQPTARLAWDLVDHTLWAAVSRAVRTPSLGERDFRRLLAPAVLSAGSPENPLPLPLGIALAGNPHLDAERLIAYELGWHGKLGGRIAANIALYRHDYEKLVDSGLSSGVTCAPSGASVAEAPSCLFTSTHVLAQRSLFNGNRAKDTGIELDTTVRITPALDLSAQLTLRDLDFDAGATGTSTHTTSSYGPGDPDLLASVQLAWQATDALQVNLNLRHVSAADRYDIDAYTAADVRIAWRAAPALRLEFLGSNLLAGSHREYASELGDVDAGKVKPTVAARVTWTR